MFDLPEDYTTASKETLAGGSAGLPCPYPAPEMYWRHGDMALATVKEIKDARRYGGWGIDRIRLEELNNLPPELPSSWALFENLVSKKDGKEYSAYMTRQAWAAPIARRYRWNDYSNRSEVQYLAYLAIPTPEKKLLPWGMVILSAKSLDTKPLDHIFKDFETRTASLRGKTAAAYFYTPAGTWATEPIFETRHGKNGASSQVTPPQLYVPSEGFAADNLKELFVGGDIAGEMVNAMRDPALRTWLDEWNKKKSDKPTEPNNDDINQALAEADEPGYL